MADPHILIVTARYYADIVTTLEAGAIAALEAAGASHEVLEAPGAFEIPGLISYAHAARPSRQGPLVDGYVALGCVIRGETSHYDYVCGESARALMDLTLASPAQSSTAAPGLAIGYGILTVENQDQAWARARPVAEGGKDKGGEAARACLAILDARRHLGG